jgi:hypothetical protein
MLVLVLVLVFYKMDLGFLLVDVQPLPLELVLVFYEVVLVLVLVLVLVDVQHLPQQVMYRVHLTDSYLLHAPVRQDGDIWELMTYIPLLLERYMRIL